VPERGCVEDQPQRSRSSALLGGADKLSRVAWLQSDPAVADVLGIEAVPSQSTLSRFFGVFTQPANDRLVRLHGWAVGKLPSRQEGYTLDLDSWAFLHKDGQQEGVASATPS